MIKMRAFIIIGVFVIITGFLAIAPLKRMFLPDVIIITIDALRADHLGCYGYARNTSPNIDRLARQGVCFLNCISPGSSTTSAMPSFFSGKYLKVYSKEVISNPGLMNIVDAKFTLLAEYLQQWGYYTQAFMTNGHLGRGSGFEQGFFRYNFNFSRMEGQYLSADVSRFLRQSHQGKPLFIWAHYIDTHIPYKHKRPYFDNFKDDFLYMKQDKALRVTPEDALNKFRNAYSSGGNLPRAAYIEGELSLNYYIARYDAEIRYIDDHLEKLLKHLRKNSIIIICADHGESLGEHNTYFSHGENIYEEVLRVPLIIKDPRVFKGGLRINTVVSSIDIVPTILNRLNPVWYFFNKNKFDGISLEATIKKKKLKHKYIYSFYPFAYSVRDTDNNFKYILYDNARQELYSLPDETNNLINPTAENAPGDVNLIKIKLKENLADWLKRYPVRCDIKLKKEPMSDKEKDNLRSLGYAQ